jgi:hypothetical protein
MLKVDKRGFEGASYGKNCSIDSDRLVASTIAPCVKNIERVSHVMMIM